MPVIFSNENGNISVSDEAIKQVAGLAALDVYGIVGMAAKDMKDGLVHLLKKESLTKGIKVSINDNVLNIEFHIIVEYGTNISAIAENAISTAEYKVKEYLGLDVADIKIFVEDIRL